MINFKIEDSDRETLISFVPKQLVIAGWTGRDAAVVNAHIEELSALGVAPPKSVPMFYRVDRELITTAPAMQVAGSESSGEAEALLVKHQGEIYVGVGSDHTDRKLEAVGITLSKQVCGKPVGERLWPWKEVSGHWDSLILRSLILNDQSIYQEGPVAGLRRPDDLLALYEERCGLIANGTIMFCGTLPVHGDIRFSPSFCVELEDPVLGRTLRHEYAVEALPIVEE